MIDLYSLIRPFLFRLCPEQSHDLSLKLLKIFYRLRLTWPIRYAVDNTKLQTRCGIQVAHPVGLAAGLDKNADYIDALSEFGFSFIEVGTVTPKAQSGNEKPRLFRLAQNQAIINRMGFNNQGVANLLFNLKRCGFQNTGALGVNIGKNKTTPNQDAVNDYLYALTVLYPYADYFTINISSPNTPGLRALQTKDALEALLERIKNHSEHLAVDWGAPKPLWLKVAPDLNDESLADIVALAKLYQLEALVLTNTTLDRPNINDVQIKEQGGLSGKPLFEKSNQFIAKVRALAGDELGIIGVGGILSAADAKEKMRLGADLVQLYSGLIYRGYPLVRECVECLV